MEQILAANLQGAGDIGQDRRQGSNFQRIVRGNRNVVLRGSFQGEAAVAAGLPGNPLADLRERPRQLNAGKVTGELHPAISSSRTK
jgi:hypothetical protein